MVFRRDAGPNSKFYFVTPIFAQKLLLKCESPRREQFIDLYVAVNNKMEAILSGRVSVEGALKRDRGELEPSTWQERLEFDERSLTLKKQAVELQKIKRDNDLQTIKMLLEFGDTGGAFSDERGALERKDIVTNTIKRMQANTWLAPLADLSYGAHPSLEDAPCVVRENPFISHIDVASAELGRRLTKSEAQKFGSMMAEAYKAEYGEKPPKSMQTVNGRNCAVNQYRESHIPLIKRVVAEFKQIGQS